MKILYITKGDSPDYMNDVILHGLYSLFGSDLVHTGPCYYMYKQYTQGEKLTSLYGRGFTVFGTLPEYLNDNSDINSKINNKYFDYIIYGSIHRDQSYLDIILNNYSTSKIAFIDGEDHNKILNINDKILYFKRELDRPSVGTPISFSIPEEKIVKDTSNIIKIRKESNVKPNPTPGSHQNFIYDKEEDYYRDYQESFFGYTKMKGGWDCMRHYEILANYCIPYFPDIVYCPERTLTNFPKETIKITNNLYLSNISNDRYYELLNYLYEYTKENLTTIKSVKNILDILKKQN